MDNIPMEAPDEIPRSGTREWYQYIGRMGGQANIKKHGRERMTEIGLKGGNALLAKKGKGYYGNLRKAYTARKEAENHDVHPNANKDIAE